jgi:hypothetical protein
MPGKLVNPLVGHRRILGGGLAHELAPATL